MVKRHPRVFASLLLMLATVTVLLLTHVITVYAWDRYGGWGFSAGSGCTGIGFIQQPPGAPETDSGWFTDLCE